MKPMREKVIPIYIEDEMRDSYIDYSMSVIVGRALPDVRDGLKHVHRRILFSMHEMGLEHTKAYKKSARVVGDVLGKYHPHGDQAVYDTLVRMVQDFSLRYPLIDGQGNFGSIDGDSAAAMRYTEARMAKVTKELLKDIEKETVSFTPNFDESLKEPTVLPAKFPTLLANGASGIAVGMATNIPPHNLTELVNGIVAFIDDQDIEDEKLLEYISGPDFPTGAIIYGTSGIRDAYLTGRGKIVVRGKVNIESKKNGKSSIVITEIPFQVNKSNLIEKIVSLVKTKKILGITDLRDESDRDGMRLVIELKRDAYPSVIINQLYKMSQLQSNFNVIMLAIVDGEPKVLKLKEMISLFTEHRRDIVEKRTRFELEKAEARAHILEGLKIALDNIDEIIALIKKSKSPAVAKEQLIKRFELSEIQAQAILDMRLQRLTGLEREKIEEEYLQLIQKIEEYRSILASIERQMMIVKNELVELKESYGDERRTLIVQDLDEFSIEDLIAEEDMVITISFAGYIKRLPVGTYRSQRRGGKGLTGVNMREDDFVEHIFVASTHSYILFFTRQGRCYWLKVHEIPKEGRLARGKAIVNLLQLRSDEKIAAFVPVQDFSKDQCVIFATKRGIIKKTKLEAFSRPLRSGINAVNIDGNDELIGADLTSGDQNIILATHQGQAIQFSEMDVRAMGRIARGVKGIRLRGDDFVVAMVVVKRKTALLTVCENGYGKRTKIDDYRVTGRGGLGVRNIIVSERNGSVVTVKEVVDEDSMIVITQSGMIIRFDLDGVRVIGRNTQGVRIINLKENDRVMDVARVVSEEKEDLTDNDIIAESENGVE